MPETSIVIPTYNRADVVPRAIESALNQTYEDFEVIVVDDGSTDDTPRVIDQLQDDRLQYVRYEENQGANHARNVGIDHASGRYISFLDSDDEFKPLYLETVLKQLKQSPTNCVGVFTAVEKIEDRDIVDISPAKQGLIQLQDIIKRNIIGGFSQITVEKRTFKNIGLLDEKLQSRQDYDFYLRLLETYSMVGVDKPLVKHYKDGNRITDDIDKIRSGHDLLYKKHPQKLKRGSLYYSLAFSYARNGQLSSTRRYFYKSVKEDPTNLLSYYHLFFCFFGWKGFYFSKKVKRMLKTYRF